MTVPSGGSGLFDALARWYRRWSVAREDALGLQCAGAVEVERIAHELGLSTFELQQLINHPDDRELLRDRMAVLHLDAAALAQSDSAMLRDMQRICALCGVRDRCARDLAEQGRDPAWQDWQDYCPNATMLSALAALRAPLDSRETK